MSTHQNTIDITLPSGLAGVIRDIELGDIKRLSPDKQKGMGTPPDPIADFLRGIWVETTDPGPYTWANQSVIDSGGKVDWSKALQIDAASFLIDARFATFGDSVHFKPICKAGNCENEYDWDFLISNLDRTGLSELAHSQMESEGTDALFNVDLPRSGLSVAWKVLTRADQFRVDLASEGNEKLRDTYGMMARLPRISGHDSPGQRRRFVEKMSLIDVEFLGDLYREHDATLQDTIETRCPKCNHRNTVALPVDRDFFSSRSARPPKEQRPEFDK